MDRQHTIIVGGTRGAGRALARTFSTFGHQVSILGRRDPVEEDRSLSRVNHWLVDLADASATTKIIGEVKAVPGKLANLIFCQRYRGKEDAWQGEMDVSVTATKRILELLTDDFASAGGGSIVVISSIASRFIVNDQPVGYHAAKAALTQMVRYYAVVLGPKKIRMNMISPFTFVKEESKEYYSGQHQLNELLHEIVPLGRMGTTDDIANVAAFLCSDAASFLTGQEIVLDGGLSLRGQEFLARQLVGIK